MANFQTTATVTCKISASPGANVYTATLPTTDTYNIQGTLQLPNVVPAQATYGAGGGAGSGTGGGLPIASTVVLVVKQGTTTIYTSTAGDRGFLTGVTATAGDVITINLFSSTAQDQQLNAAQLTVAISEGAI